MEKYVVGIIFDTACENTLLIRKNRPVWQAGRLNGVGGRIEADETPYAAMVRECEEECGLVLENWSLVKIYSDKKHFAVYYFATTTSNLSFALSITDECLEIWKVENLHNANIVPPTEDFLNISYRSLK
jgi:8-oxo-dGTP diphosphatase